MLNAWKEFRRSKGSKKDIQQFEFKLEDNIFQLQKSLQNGSYQHGPYQKFLVYDPKPRTIHKAGVRDRLLHQAVYRKLYQIFDPHFIFDSYSCRRKKGVHRAINQLESFIKKVSANYHQPVYVLKCDVRKFFDSIDQRILFHLIQKKVRDLEALNLIRLILKSFELTPGKGLPLGNATSQLFSNIYLNELDQFVKHQIKAKYYLRYCDDFVVVHHDPVYLKSLIEPINLFLQKKLNLTLHPNKISIRKLRQGIDYLGYVTLPHFRVLRTKTKQRILKKKNAGKIDEKNLPSYLGMLKHCRGRKITENFWQPPLSPV